MPSTLGNFTNCYVYFGSANHPTCKSTCIFLSVVICRAHKRKQLTRNSGLLRWRKGYLDASKCHCTWKHYGERQPRALAHCADQRRSGLLLLNELRDLSECGIEPAVDVDRSRLLSTLRKILDAVVLGLLQKRADEDRARS